MYKDKHLKDSWWLIYFNQVKGDVENDLHV